MPVSADGDTSVRLGDGVFQQADFVKPAIDSRTQSLVLGFLLVVGSRSSSSGASR